MLPDFGGDPFFTSETVQNLLLPIANDDIDTVVMRNHPSLDLSFEVKKDVGGLGYRAKIKSADIWIFSEIRDEEISMWILYSSARWST